MYCLCPHHISLFNSTNIFCKHHGILWHNLQIYKHVYCIKDKMYCYIPEHVWTHAWLEWWPQDQDSRLQNWHKSRFWSFSFGWKVKCFKCYFNYVKHSWLLFHTVKFKINSTFVFWRKNTFKLGSMKHQPDIKSEQEGNEDSWNDYVT